jgi:hypothetical protein
MADESVCPTLQASGAGVGLSTILPIVLLVYMLGMFR